MLKHCDYEQKLQGEIVRFTKNMELAWKTK